MPGGGEGRLADGGGVGVHEVGAVARLDAGQQGVGREVGQGVPAHVGHPDTRGRRYGAHLAGDEPEQVEALWSDATTQRLSSLRIRADAAHERAEAATAAFAAATGDWGGLALER